MNFNSFFGGIKSMTIIIIVILSIRRTAEDIILL